jgi:DNA-binding CsgD family transcriptional regulator
MVELQHVSGRATLDALTPAEMRVFALLVEGHSTGKIAETLAIAPSTIRTHIIHIFRKTGQHSRADLVRLAWRADRGIPT